MSGNNILLDTNILIYLLNGDNNLVNILSENNCYISFVTELELLSYYHTTSELKIIKSLLNELTIIDINQLIKKYVIEIRISNKIKLPDCIIAATSKYLKIPLFTSDLDFEKVKSIDVILYNKIA
jgi:predicted nucleic acid-binding protein